MISFESTPLNLVWNIEAVYENDMFQTRLEPFSG